MWCAPQKRPRYDTEVQGKTRAKDREQETLCGRKGPGLTSRKAWLKKKTGRFKAAHAACEKPMESTRVQRRRVVVCEDYSRSPCFSGCFSTGNVR
ncbi:uncharacterized protein PITG_17382 [Phytophthora infestans T30-4]|uniref:Uncharacterized protein n=1 Tax=Phytophthora infestans (strain T30-4) TaxID=403677 RepID=D0NVX9_PHYIT|nr:uncharacterized protein PITG_17382 [Phytophthora infestans T30-4]EEY66815.1 hypothetical protein PITG_17382 [Phytophthora infestans T30-4]|eukprot:XP_002896702.1 hypothetical protein PITG_17382 [Phytophthora infestans T30-4]